MIKKYIRTKEIDMSILSKERAVLMGISILLILFYHFTEDCMGADIHYSGFARFFYVHFRSSSVDAFLFLSGFGLFYSMKKNSDVKAFYQRKFFKILVPYIIIAVPSFILVDIWGLKYTGLDALVHIIEQLTFITFFLEGKKLYWYIGFILLCYILYPYIYKLVDSSRDEAEEFFRWLVLSLATTIVAILIEDGNPKKFVYWALALTRFPSFFAGCFFAKACYEKRKGYFKWFIIFMVSGGALYLNNYKNVIINYYIESALNISVLALIALCFYLFEDRLGGVKKLLEWFGCRTLEIYLVSVSVRKIMKQFGYNTCIYSNQIIMLILSFIIVMLLIQVSKWISERISCRLVHT